jgi:hypothetical protein
VGSRKVVFFSPSRLLYGSEHHTIPLQSRKKLYHFRKRAREQYNCLVQLFRRKALKAGCVVESDLVETLDSYGKPRQDTEEESEYGSPHITSNSASQGAVLDNM